MPLSRLQNLKTVLTSPRKSQTTQTEAAQLDRNFESLLAEQDVSLSLREKLRTMDPFVKQSFVQVSTSTSRPSTPNGGHRKHGRSRSRNIFSPIKKKRQVDAAECITEPLQCIRHLTDDTKSVELAILQKLKLLLRTQRIAWTTEFIELGGIAAIHKEIERIKGIEWRDDEDDRCLAEILACASSAAAYGASDALLISLVDLFFSEKQPSDFKCRGQILNILNIHLNAMSEVRVKRDRALRILSLMEEPRKPLLERPLEMLERAHMPRPFKRWMDELEKPIKDCFWIFLHSDNTVTTLTPGECSVMRKRAPIPASGYVGGVEWTAVEYITHHLTLVNSILSSIEAHERQEVRQHLRTSHFERMCGRQLRRASTKYYPYLHEELVIWASRAMADGWPTTTVVTGSCRDDADIATANRTKLSTQTQGQKRHGRTQSQFLPELKF